MGVIDDVSLQGLKGKDLEQRLIVLNGDVFLQRVQEDFLGELALVLKLDLNLGGETLKDFAEV